jgi:hypothetical protein
MCNRNLGILEASIAIQMADAKLGHLAGATGNRILVALAAGLRVVQRSEAVSDLLYFIEHSQIRLMRRGIRDPITAVVKSGRRFRSRARSRRRSGERCIGENETQNCQRDHCVHGTLSSRHPPDREA